MEQLGTSGGKTTDPLSAVNVSLQGCPIAAGGISHAASMVLLRALPWLLTEQGVATGQVVTSCGGNEFRGSMLSFEAQEVSDNLSQMLAISLIDE
jgi:hypothetical protein